MKRILLVVLVVIIAGGLFLSCGGGTPSTTSPTTSITTTTPPTTTPPPVAKTYNLKFAYHTPPYASMVPTYFKPWTASIEAATSNQVKITHYAGESLVKAKDVYDAVTSGLCDIGLIDTSEYAGRFSQMEFDTLPFMFPNTAVGAKVYWDIVQKYAMNVDFKDVVVLGVCVVAPSNYAGNKPAVEIADFKGMRVRTAGKTESWTIEALGGTPIEVGTSDLYTALERGMIDSCFLSWSMINRQVKGVSKYRTECNLFYRAWPIVMNKQAWNSLTPALQQTIMSLSGRDNSAKYCAANEAMAAEDKAEIVAADIKAGNPAISILTAAQAAAWKAAIMPVWDKWSSDLQAKGLPGIAILADVKSLASQYSK